MRATDQHHTSQVSGPGKSHVLTIALATTLIVATVFSQASVPTAEQVLSNIATLCSSTNLPPAQLLETISALATQPTRRASREESVIKPDAIIKTMSGDYLGVFFQMDRQFERYRQSSTLDLFFKTNPSMALALVPRDGLDDNPILTVTDLEGNIYEPVDLYVDSDSTSPFAILSLKIKIVPRNFYPLTLSSGITYSLRRFPPFTCQDLLRLDFKSKSARFIPPQDPAKALDIARTLEASIKESFLAAQQGHLLAKQALDRYSQQTDQQAQAQAPDQK